MSNIREYLPILRFSHIDAKKKILPMFDGPLLRNPNLTSAPIEALRRKCRGIFSPQAVCGPAAARGKKRWERKR